MLTSDAEADLFSFVNEKLPTTPMNIKITINTVKHPQPVLAQPFPEVVLLPCDAVSACALCGSVKIEIKEVQTMKRYQILYNKAGFPLCVWKSSEAEARSFANRFRAAGYSVDVWEHTETGARKTNI